MGVSSPSPRIRTTWERLRASYWFVPSVMAAVAFGLAGGLVTLDDWLDSGRLQDAAWLYGGRPEGARQLLSVVATTMMTVAGVAFSITIVALVLASNKFGPRLLRNFLRDLGNQVVLGTFIGTYLYCLLVLRAVRSAGESGGAFVPNVAVSGAVVLAVASVGVLIWFIHHIAESINAPSAIAKVAAELREAIDHLTPDGHATPDGQEERDAPDDVWLQDCSGWLPLRARRGGYVHAVDKAALLQSAQEHDLFVAVQLQPGQFVLDGGTVALVGPPGRVTDALLHELSGAVTVGEQRTLTQDPEFAVVQLVEVALRALSPGVNEPYTAIDCIDWLGQGLARLAERAPPRTVHHDERGVVRALVPTRTFAGMLDASFNEIRQAATASPAVLIRLLEALTGVARAATRAGDREALRRHVDMIWDGARRHTDEPRDLDDVAARHRAALQALHGRAAPIEERTELH